jgi:hypothetical protein
MLDESLRHCTDWPVRAFTVLSTSLNAAFGFVLAQPAIASGNTAAKIIGTVFICILVFS